MKIEKKYWGEVVTIPETEHNSEFVYRLRSVRKLNWDCPEEEELINELEPKEKIARRRFLILAKSMEYFFKRISTEGNRIFEEWEKKNKCDWNEYYHWQLDLLEEEVNSYSFEFARRSRHGWCL